MEKLLKRGLLYASTNVRLRNNLMRVPFIQRSVLKFMPGDRIDDVVPEAMRLQEELQLGTILTRLGENITSLREGADITNHYLDVIDLFDKHKLNTQLAIKPTQLGYDQDPEVCYKNCLVIMKKCTANGQRNEPIMFWLDMESHPYVDGTIALFKRLRAHTPHVGIAIQAALYRSENDLEALIPLGSAIRIVKGAYMEPDHVAMKEKKKIDENYFKLVARLLQDDNIRPGALTHIATHDVDLQERLLAVIKARNVDQRRYSFAMLYGIRTTRQTELVAKGQPQRCLIAYGEFWWPWYMRRLAENPIPNVAFVLKNLFKS